ncbi:MAG: type II secretion system F family protein [Pirellulaceae bacterium]|nr:type II secretion system F family protein [Pirellulaceae bacterium]
MGSTLIVAAVFVGVTALVGGVALLLRGSRSSLAEDRLELLTGAGGAAVRTSPGNTPSLWAGTLNDTLGFLEQYVPSFTNLSTFLEQAGSALAPSRFVLISLALGCAGAALCMLGLLGDLVWILAAPVAFVLAASLPTLWMYLKRQRRLKAFARQLPDALELVARALRAGHSLAAGFHLVAQEMAEPISKEFNRCYEEQNFGIPLDQALEDMTRRVPNLDLRFFATAVILQRQTGGDLAEILDKIGRLIRERFKIWGQIQALTGEGRLSGLVLLALPPLLFLAMLRLNPGYVMTLFTDPLGHRMLALAIVMQLVGALVIRKIVNIKV